MSHVHLVLQSSSDIDRRLLLTKLKTLLAEAPDLSQFTHGTPEQLQWLGKGSALLQKWDSLEAAGFKTVADFLHMELTRQGNISMIFGSLHRAVAALELQIETDASPQTAIFGPGAVYDFFVALKKVLSSAEKEVFIIDPWVDAGIFDSYLRDCKRNLAVRLLVKTGAPDFKSAAQLYLQQNQTDLQIRRNSNLHDRVVFVDRSITWVLGQSINIAAESKVTYLAPLSPDITTLKLPFYEDIWKGSTAI